MLKEFKAFALKEMCSILPLQLLLAAHLEKSSPLSSMILLCQPLEPLWAELALLI